MGIRENRTRYQVWLRKLQNILPAASLGDLGKDAKLFNRLFCGAESHIINIRIWHPSGIFLAPGHLEMKQS